jgi:hypothetical protein
MDKRLSFAGLAALLLAAPQRSTSIFGRWAGESRCVGAHPGCHPEHVLYQVDSGATKIVMKGARTAGSDTVDMGDLECRRLAAAEMTCPIGPGVWRFWVAQDSLRGTLTATDGSLMRQVAAGRRPGAR